MSKPIYATPCISLNGVSTGTGGAFAMDRADTIRVSIVPSAAPGAGVVRVEGASDAAYSGTWSRIDDIAYNDDNWNRTYAEAYEFVRLRITTNFTGATLVGTVQGFT